jgi:hypothetical protein
LVRLGQEELIVGSQATIADETARRLGTTESSRKPNDQQCFLEIPVLRIRNLPAGTRGSRGSRAAAANVTGLNPVRDVLLGVLFVLWIAWWISVLVVLHAKPIHLPPLPRHDAACAAPCW